MKTEMPITIIATVGPSTLKPEILKKLRERKVDFIRLNFFWSWP